MLKNASLALPPVVLRAFKHSLPPSLEAEGRFGFLKAKGLQACFSDVDQLGLVLQFKEI